MKQKLFGLAAMFLALIFCVSTCAAIDLSSQGYNHSIVAGPGNVTVISFDYDTGGNDTTVNFRRLKDDGGDGWMMPVDFTSTGIVVDSDYGPYSYSASLSGVHNYVFMLNSANGLWTLAIDGTEVDFVGTSSTTTPQPDGTAVTVGAVVADKYFSDETDVTAINAEYLGWTADAGDGVGSSRAYKIKFPAASGSSVDNIVVTPTPMDGMVMYYDFQTVGATVADRSGNGNDAAVVGNVTGALFGRSGADATFGGTSSDALDVVATPLADRPSSAVTIAAWCKIDDTEDHQSIFNAFGPKPSDPGSNAYLYHMEIRTGSDQYRWCVRNSEGETIGNIQETVTPVITGEWVHFACTYDSAPADANNLKVFINGEYLTGMAAEAVSDLNIGTNWDSGAAIGYTADAQSRNYKGQMDEFYMFNRALTPAEISTLASVSWLNNGGFETGDLAGWTTFDGSEYGEWGEAGTYEIIESPNSIGQGDYSAQITGGQQCGIAQTVAIPAGTLVQIDSLWSGTCGTNYWAEIKVLTHSNGAAYNLNESDMGSAYTGDWQYLAKSDTYGPLNPKPGGIWEWEDAATGSPMAGNTIISRGEVIVATKIGGASGMVMAVDNVALTPLYSVFKATAPSPTDEAFIVVESPDDVNAVTLEWDGGFLAASHDVYLGTDFDDVNTATKTSPEFMGNQAATSYVPTLAGGTTYFWRIDEVNGVDTWKGDIWSFEVGKIPVIDDPILWYKFDEGSGTDVGDSSGNGFDGVMDYARWDEGPDGSNCYVNLNAWSRNFVDVPNDAFADINEMCSMSIWLWEEDPNDRSDGAQWSTIWRGGNLTDPDRTVIINNEGISNSSGWDPPDSWQWFTVSRMGADHDFNHDPTGWSAATYNYNGSWAFFGRDYYANPIQKWRHITVVKDNTDYDGNGSLKIYHNGILKAENNRDNCNKSMAGIDKFQLGGNYDDGNWWARFVGKFDDFRIYDRPLNDVEVKQLVGNYFQKAAGPDPVDEAEDVPLEGTVLSWAAGQDAVSHQVYLSDDRIEVKNADVNSPCYRGEQTGTTYDPGSLSLMKTYYWRVDEVDDEGTIYKGDLWSFSSSPYIMIEDFESYDNDGNDVTVTWVDVDTSGAGDMQRFLAVEPDYPVLSMVNSLRLRYRLTAWGDFAYYAKTSRSFSPAQDWTEGGVAILTINYYGDAGNFGLPMFVTVGDGTTEASVYVDANTLDESWNEVNVSLAEVAAAGVDLSSVSYMEIGFGDGTNQGSSSSQYDMIYVDDIALYPPKCVVSESTLQADITEDCVVNYDDLDELAFDWLLGGYTVSAAGAVSDDGLVLHYDFENNTVDSVAGNNGTLQSLGGTASYDTGHDGGRCIHFNASATDSGSNMIVPPAAFADVNEEVTFSLWLKNDTDAPPWYMNVFGATSTSTNRTNLFRLYSPAYMGNMLSVFHAGSGGNSGWGDWDAIQFTQPETFDYLAWNHLALVKNCYNGEMWFYANGELMIHKRGEINKMYGCDEFKLGSNYGDAAFWPGCIDDFRVYNRALSHAEVLTLAGQASATVPISMFNAEDSDVNGDAIVDFKDYSVLAGEWLVEDLWP